MAIQAKRLMVAMKSKVNCSSTHTHTHPQKSIQTVYLYDIYIQIRFLLYSFVLPWLARPIHFLLEVGMEKCFLKTCYVLIRIHSWCAIGRSTLMWLGFYTRCASTWHVCDILWVCTFQTDHNCLHTKGRGLCDPFTVFFLLVVICPAPETLFETTGTSLFFI